MQRKLASVQQISALDPIAGADSIERATVLGWSVVVKKGDFKVGDHCVFFEIDSVLPGDASWARFMEPRKFRVKTMKLRGCLSQGLALSTEILPYEKNVSWNQGDDVTDVLGVTKFEPVLPTSGADVAGSFPHNIPKTDEIRLQSITGILEELKDKPFYVTVKCDGMSTTYAKMGGELIVCSRNWSLKDGNNDQWNIARKYDLANVLPEGFCIQGELCGPGIQKNRLNLKAPDLFVFNVFDIGAQRFLNYDEFVMFCSRLGLKTVPFDFEVDADELKSFPFALETFLELARGTYEGTTNRREGIVVRPLIECRSQTLNNERFSFKVINNEFLLADED